MTLSLASLSTIPLWWLCPESVKWLYSAGKGEQGREILEKLAQQKGVKLPDSIELDLPKDEPKTDGADEKLLLEEKNGGGGKVAYNVTEINSRTHDTCVLFAAHYRVPDHRVAILYSFYVACRKFASLAFPGSKLFTIPLHSLF